MTHGAYVMSLKGAQELIELNWHADPEIRTQERGAMYRVSSGGT